MKSDTMKAATDVADERLFDNFGSIRSEKVLRTKVRGFIETMIEEELEMALSRPRYGPADGAVCGRSRRQAACRPSAWPSDAIVDRHIRPEDDGMEEQVATAYQRRTRVAML